MGSTLIFNVDFRTKNPVGKSVPELAVSRHIWKENYSEESAFYMQYALGTAAEASGDQFSEPKGRPFFLVPVIH